MLLNLKIIPRRLSDHLVLEFCGKLQRVDEGEAFKVRDGVQQGPLAGVQGCAGDLYNASSVTVNNFDCQGGFW